jgi:hypothetical protein
VLQIDLVLHGDSHATPRTKLILTRGNKTTADHKRRTGLGCTWTGLSRDEITISRSPDPILKNGYLILSQVARCRRTAVVDPMKMTLRDAARERSGKSPGQQINL